MLAADGGNAEEMPARFSQAGVDYHAVAAKLQRDCAESFDASWSDLMGSIASKSALLTTADRGS
jgi:transaldolase